MTSDEEVDTEADSDGVAPGCSTTGGVDSAGGAGASQYSPTQWAYLSLLPASHEPSIQAAT